MSTPSMPHLKSSPKHLVEAEKRRPKLGPEASTIFYYTPKSIFCQVALTDDIIKRGNP